MSFLRQAEAYSPILAQKTCHSFRLYKEEAFLLIKMGREEDAIRLLITNCPNVTEAVDFALALNITDQNVMWDMVLASSAGDTTRLNSLFSYIE